MPLFKETEDPRKGLPSTSVQLRPIEGWQMTGLVQPGENGPGCPVGCIYCNQMGMDTDRDGMRVAGYLSLSVDGGISLNTRLQVGNKVDRQISPTELLGRLKEYPYYNPDSSLILENFNDPGIDWEQTAVLIDGLISNLGHQGPIALITKMGIKPEQVERFRELKDRGAKIVPIVTYSGMPKEIEKSSAKVRISTMQRFAEAGFPVILSIRPLVEGINANEENIERVLMEANPYIAAVIAGGLFVFDTFTLDAFKKAGYELPGNYAEDIYSIAKAMPRDYKTWVRQIAQQLEIDAVVHDHTSCAIADLTTRYYRSPRPDRFAHWVSHSAEPFCDCGHCPTEQRQQCECVANNDWELISAKAQSALRAIGYPDLKVTNSVNISGLLLVMGGELSYEEFSYLKEQVGWYCDNLPSPEGLFNISAKTINEDVKPLLGKDAQTIIHGAVLVGQEWQMILKNCSTAELKIIERWLRARLRHRVSIHRLESLKTADLARVVDDFTQKSHGIQTRAQIADSLRELIEM